MCPSLVLLLWLSLQPISCVHSCSRRTRTSPLFFFPLNCVRSAALPRFFRLQFDYDNGVGSSVDRFAIDLYSAEGTGDCGTFMYTLCDKPSIGCKDSSECSPSFLPVCFRSLHSPLPPRCPPLLPVPLCCSTSSARHLVCCFRAIPPVPRVDKSFLPFSRFPWFS